ncbi:MAG: NERD domain-containing protein [Phototrophicaceae bacterium]
MMQNVAPTRSLTRIARQLLLVAFVLVSIGIFIGTVGVLLLLIPFSAPNTNGYGVQRAIATLSLILGAGVAVGGLGFALRALTRRTDNDLAYKTGKFLLDVFDERYTFIRNINRPKLGYIDAVLVGPPGVLVFRIVNTPGEFLNEGAGWVKRNAQGQSVLWRVSPTKEAIKDVESVRTFLQEGYGLSVDVYAVVLFTTSPEVSKVDKRQPVVPVAHLTTLVDSLRTNYLAKERLHPKDTTHISSLLLGE